MRTAQDRFDALTRRGRTPAQIRAIAVAIEDKELRVMANDAMKAEIAAEVAKATDVIKVEVTKA